MNVEAWQKGITDQDMYYIGYSNGYTYCSKLAKKNKKKEPEEFVQICIKNMAEEIKRVTDLDKKQYPDNYKHGYNMAISTCRLSMLREFLASKVGDTDGDNVRVAEESE